MTHIVKDKLAALLLEYPKPKGIVMGYGTAGFRARADTLPWIMIRIGLLAALRSKVKRGESFFYIKLNFYNLEL
jgi:phosphoacetylglucosamine mutase